MFAVLTAVWLLAGMLLVSHHRLVEILRQRSVYVVPVVYIMLGVYIIDRCGLLFGHFLI